MSELDQFFENKMNEECGVFGIFNHENAAELTYYGLHALQHRGQEGAGIVSSDGHALHQHKGEGLVRNVFTQQDLDRIKGIHAIGHVRYSTAGGGGIMNVQPFLFRSQTGPLGLCHNGNLVNANQLKDYLENLGSIFQTTSDSEILAHLIKRQRGEMIDCLKESLLYIEGAFAFLLLKENEMYIALDKFGLRPLSLGRIGNKGIVVASETCAFDVVGAEYLRDVQPGEVIRIDLDGMTSDRYAACTEQNMCSMEYVYFARPDSDIEQINVHQARKNCGRVLAQEAPVEADIVVGVPDSGLSAAIGYAEEAKIPFEFGMIKNKYIGRTFIQPSQELRERGVKMKLSAVRSIVKDKRVILIDDSIVRGTTSRRMVDMLREAGAKEVHVRIASPEIKFPCFYGVDFSTYEELIAATHSLEEITAIIGADSLAFISVDGLTKGVGRQHALGKNCGQCVACFNGDYPTYLYDDVKSANKEVK
ncbi:MAG TPA: amidophosphoribosyltransferase [Firmicutes bacterium]|nr:amidophosphoribosyltransferase [Bacillota bacterium]